MPVRPLDDIDIPSIQEILLRRDISLWILPGASSEDVTSLLSLPWINIWNSSALEIEKLWEVTKSSRSILKVSRPEQDYLNFRVTEFVRLYDIQIPSSQDRRILRNVDRLKDNVERITGMLCFVGNIEGHWDDVMLAHDLAPGLLTLAISGDLKETSSDSNHEVLLWEKGVERLGVVGGHV